MTYRTSSTDVDAVGVKLLSYLCSCGFRSSFESAPHAQVLYDRCTVRVTGLEVFICDVWTAGLLSFRHISTSDTFLFLGRKGISNNKFSKYPFITNAFDQYHQFLDNIDHYVTALGDKGAKWDGRLIYHPQTEISEFDQTATIKNPDGTTEPKLKIQSSYKKLYAD